MWQISTGFALVLFIAFSGAYAAETITSPSGALTVTVKVVGDRLYYSLNRGSDVLLEDSPLGVTVDGIDLGGGVSGISGSAVMVTNETYATRGVHPIAVNHYHEMIVTVNRSGGGDSSFTMIFRVFDDGVAYRYQIPGSGTRTISGEASGWHLPVGTLVWYQSNTSNYEGIYNAADIGSFDSDMGGPFVCKLTNNAGYLLCSESDVQRYSGMTYDADNGNRIIRGEFLDDSNWSVDAGSYTPWRVTIVSYDLNGIVNSDLIRNVATPPDPTLFPDGINTAWIRPGRSLWSWWADGTIDWNHQKYYADKAGELGMEYILVDEHWEDWSNGSQTKWDLVTEVVDHAGLLGVSVNLWKRWSGINNPAGDYSDMRLFFDQVKQTGAVGVKIDFMDTESVSMLDFYNAALRIGAEKQLMINFHGANKPMGEDRTWPNEMTREGVYGLEYNKFLAIEQHHYAALPFTRGAVAQCDFTPGSLVTNDVRLRGTSWPMQLAMGVVLTSPLLHWTSNPGHIDDALPAWSPQRELFVNIPSAWDETIVLDISQIGDLAAMARRKDNLWFLAMVNGTYNSRVVENVDLSFLSSSAYVTDAIFLFDQMDNGAAFDVQQVSDLDYTSYDLDIPMRTQGGFIGMFVTTPVAAPSGVTATVAGGGNIIELTWIDNSDNESGFIIERKPYHNYSGWWTEIAQVGPNVATYTDTTDLHGQVEYTYRIGAFINNIEVTSRSIPTHRD